MNSAKAKAYVENLYHELYLHWERGSIKDPS